MFEQSDGQMTFEFQERPTIKGFPELRWTGKRPYRSTQYYPAQLKERYGEEAEGWINKIFWGDNLQVMSHLLKEYRGKVDLIYIDPPIIIFVFLLLTRFFSHFHFFIEIFSKSMSFPLAMNHGYSDV